MELTCKWENSIFRRWWGPDQSRQRRFRERGAGLEAEAHSFHPIVTHPSTAFWHSKADCWICWHPLAFVLNPLFLLATTKTKLGKRTSTPENIPISLCMRICPVNVLSQCDRDHLLLLHILFLSPNATPWKLIIWTTTTTTTKAAFIWIFLHFCICLGEDYTF